MLHPKYLSVFLRIVFENAPARLSLRYGAEECKYNESDGRSPVILGL
jgi:hypothetical protein